VGCANPVDSRSRRHRDQLDALALQRRRRAYHGGGTSRRTAIVVSQSPLDRINSSGVIAVIRLNERMRASTAQALVAGGVSVLEITLTTPGALDAVASISADVPGSVVGAGTVLDAASARDVIAAGARFVVSPVFDAEVVRICLEHEILCMPGVFTPTEMLHAWRAGAPLLKVFPSAQSGPSFFRDVLAPMPFLRLVPSGGVSVATAGDWIRAGAAAVSVGSSFINATTVRESNAASLTEQAKALVAAVASARRPPPPQS
jgi:2-dehydro-3-deoxyphosphogluconate aldolase/(4S)-4-hydroxy-2-oxoglutarate aldolase